jgi:hypothetical protein
MGSIKDKFITTNVISAHFHFITVQIGYHRLDIIKFRYGVNPDKW